MFFIHTLTGQSSFGGIRRTYPILGRWLIDMLLVGKRLSTRSYEKLGRPPSDLQSSPLSKEVVLRKSIRKTAGLRHLSIHFTFQNQGPHPYFISSPSLATKWNCFYTLHVQCIKSRKPLAPLEFSLLLFFEDIRLLSCWDRITTRFVVDVFLGNYVKCGKFFGTIFGRLPPIWDWKFWALTVHLT